MACDMRVVNKGQSLSDRKKQVKKTIDAIERAIVKNQVKIAVGKQGAIAFQLPAAIDRAAISDACIYRLIMRGNSVLAKAAIQQAERIAGRGVDKLAIARGDHSHDGGETWHHGKG